jgi:hypothetical protein
VWFSAEGLLDVVIWLIMASREDTSLGAMNVLLSDSTTCFDCF